MTAAKTGRAVELPSPVASLVPGLVLNTVVTFGDRLYWPAAIPIKRVPVLRDLGRRPRRILLGGARQMARKRKKESKGNSAVLPVMRPDAAGIDIGATEIYVAVAPDRDVQNVRS